MPLIHFIILLKILNITKDTKESHMLYLENYYFSHTDFETDPKIIPKFASTKEVGFCL